MPREIIDDATGEMLDVIPNNDPGKNAVALPYETEPLSKMSQLWVRCE